MATAAKVSVEIGAVLAGNVKSVFGNAKSRVADLGSEIKRLESNQRQVGEAIQTFGSMGKNVDGLRQKYADATDELQKHRKELTRTVGQMAALEKFEGAGIGEAFANVKSQLGSLAVQTVATGAGLGYFFKTNFLDVASQFERFQTILETTEGSSEKAKKAMDWVEQFSKTTPYELAEVTDAFVKLRSYGLEPTNGLLKSLGDTSAAMGKPIMQAVEAIADAVTGENERLKEFGIKASKEKGKITYEYTTKEGKTARATVDESNRAMIQSTLEAIMNEKYAGAMDKLSRTWEGMMSNISDVWSGFAKDVMQSGPFESMKAKLGGVLEEIQKMQSDGRLKAWAEQTGAAIMQFGETVWNFGKAVFDTTSKVAEFVGGWQNLGLILVAIKLAPLAMSIISLGTALVTGASALIAFAGGFGAILAGAKALSLFLVANPIGLAMVAAGALLIANWDTVKAVGQAVWSSVTQFATDAGNMIGAAWSTASQTLSGLWAGIEFAALSAFQGIKDGVGAIIDWLSAKVAWIFDSVGKIKGAVGSIVDGALGGVKSFFGGDDNKALVKQGLPVGSTVALAGTQANATSPSPTLPTAVPSAPTQGAVTQHNSNQYSITVAGSSDPQATAQAVRAEIDRRERERAAAQRGSLVDAMGY